MLVLQVAEMSRQRDKFNLSFDTGDARNWVAILFKLQDRRPSVFCEYCFISHEANLASQRNSTKLTACNSCQRLNEKTETSRTVRTVITKLKEKGSWVNLFSNS